MCIGYERDRPWRSSHDASSWVGPGPLPKNGVCSAPSPMKIRACFSSYGKAVPSRSFSWTPRSLDTTKWKMIKSVWKIARNMPWSFADTCDVFLNYVSSRLGADSSSQFSDSKINLDIQWYTFFNKFWWFPFKGSTDTCFSPPGRRKGFVIPQPAESHEAGWISLEVSIKNGWVSMEDDGGSIV